MSEYQRGAVLEDLAVVRLAALGIPEADPDERGVQPQPLALGRGPRRRQLCGRHLGVTDPESQGVAADVNVGETVRGDARPRSTEKSAQRLSETHRENALKGAAL